MPMVVFEPVPADALNSVPSTLTTTPTTVSSNFSNFPQIKYRRLCKILRIKPQKLKKWPTSPKFQIPKFSFGLICNIAYIFGKFVSKNLKNIKNVLTNCVSHLLTSEEAEIWNILVIFLNYKQKNRNSNLNFGLQGHFLNL
jgi:hypothetical protein